jgi:hypothetical protein
MDRTYGSTHILDGVFPGEMSFLVVKLTFGKFLSFFFFIFLANQKNDKKLYSIIFWGNIKVNLVKFLPAQKFSFASFLPPS